MKLIVGLGNPGKEYSKTRHNIGFMCVDNFAQKNGCSINKKKFNGLYTKLVVNGTEVMLLKPQSFINLSGEVIKKYLDYFKIRVEDLLVVSDDLDLEIGRYKLKCNSSSGGHNGLKSIEKCLNTQNYKRLKIGISNNKDIDTKDYVLGKIDETIFKEYQELFDITDKILEEFVQTEFDLLMSKYNHK